MKLSSTPLLSKSIRLEPLHTHHYDGLCNAVLDGELWNNRYIFVPSPHTMDLWIDKNIKAMDDGAEVTFVILSQKNNMVLGTTCFKNIDLNHKKIEIGNTWIGESWQSTIVDIESKYLLIKEAFEELECNRVEFIADALNRKENLSLMAIGAQREGFLRNHLVKEDGSIRHSIIYSIVQGEWSVIKDNLNNKVYSANPREGWIARAA